MRKFACTLVFVFFVIFTFASISAAVTVRVDPATKELPAVGNTFNIDIVVDDVTDVVGFEFDLQYDPSIVTIENDSDVSLGDFLGSTGRTASLLGPSIDNSAGLLETGAFSFGAEAGPNGSGILIKITYTVQTGASGALDLKNVILTDTSANPITVDAITDGNLTPEPTPAGGGGGGGCFIATAAYGSSMEPHVKVLREFRDRFLLTNSVGKAIVDLYHTYSPPVADLIARHDTVRLVVRWGLLPLVGVSRMILQLGSVAALGFVFLLLAMNSAIAVVALKRMRLRRKA